MVLYILLIAVLVGVFALLAHLPEWLAGDAPAALRRGREIWCRVHPPRPDEVDLHDADVYLLSLELSRLSGLVQAAHGTRQPGAHLRVESSLLAYDDVLLDCCRRLHVAIPRPRGPLTADERLDLEMALTTQGVRW